MVFRQEFSQTIFIATFPIHPAFIQNEPQNKPQKSSVLTPRQSEMLKLIRSNDRITRAQMSEELKISEATIKREIKHLREHGILSYDGPAKSGKWIINPSVNIKAK